VLHRRLVSAALAFCSVLFALQVLAPAGTETSRATTGANEVAIDDDLLQFPLRLSDAAVAELLSPGDVVDVFGSEVRGATTVVAQGLPVVEVPEVTGSAFGGAGDGLVVVAVSEGGAVDLAAATSRGPVTVAVHP
jgi:hypothetical protein